LVAANGREDKLVVNVAEDEWHCTSSDSDSIAPVNMSDITLSVDHTLSAAEPKNCVSSLAAVINDASTPSASEVNGASTLLAGDSVASDGSFNGFVIAMHRKMVHD